MNEAIEAILNVGKDLNENCPAQSARQSSWAPLIYERCNYNLSIKINPL
jgi:hypothetical protein